VARIDLFVAPYCSACPEAREVVRRFGLSHPGVEIRVWDLTQDPGPARRRGIFATPSVLLNDQTILIGVPTEAALAGHLSTSEAGHP